MKNEANDKITARLVFSRIGWFVISGFAILAIYLVVMAPLAPMIAAKIDPTDSEAKSFRFAVVYIVFAFIYIIPLYLFLFKKDIGLKTEVLHVTEDGFDLKTVFRAVYRKIGILDHVIYTAMSVLVLLGRFVRIPVFGFFMIQESGFYVLPIPEVLGCILAVLCFAAEYALCLVVASKNWDKNRLHHGGNSQSYQN